jgi:hypothetical protein
MDPPWQCDPPLNWPSSAEELLLRAAAVAGEPGRTALQAWREVTGRQRYEEVDFAATLLLPSVANNLQSSGLDDPWLRQLAGLTRYQWLQNASRLAQFSRVLAELGRAGLVPLLGGPLALVAGGYWPSHTPRPVFAGELLLAPADARRAHEKLAALGWQDAARVKPGVAGWCSECWRSPERETLSIHYALLPRRFPVIGRQDLDCESAAAHLNGVACRTVSAEHLLVQLCVRGHLPGRGRRQPLVWLLDAVRIVQSRRLDWDRLLEVATRGHAIVPLRETMRYLRERLAAPVPAGWMAAASRHEISAQERRLLAQHPHRRRFWRPLAALGDKLWHDYARAEEAAGRPATGLGRVQYAAWQLSRAWQPRRISL